jgi:hypothetical protein
MMLPTDDQDGLSAKRQSEESKWFSFAEKLPSLALEIFQHQNIQVTEKGFAEPKILALALMCRTLSNFNGALAVAKLKLVVEARTLVRCCYENLFLIGGLLEKGDEFVKSMYHDDIKGLRSRGEFILGSAEAGVAEDVVTEALRNRIAEMKQRWPKATYLNPKNAAQESALHRSWLTYSQLSGDAAHPSITALKRHLLRIVENGEIVLGLDVQPPQRGTEIADTVNLGCSALLGVCVAVNQILEYTAASPQVKELWDEYGKLAVSEN